MKLNVVKNVVSFILIITMLVIPSASLAATQFEEIEPTSVIQPRWSYLFECDNALVITEGYSRRLTAYGSTETDYDCAGVYAQLQKMNWDGTWDDVEGEEWESYSNDIYASFEDTNVKVSAGTYRLFMVHTALDSNGRILETFTAYSDTVTVY